MFFHDPELEAIRQQMEFEAAKADPDNWRNVFPPKLISDDEAAELDQWFKR